jgi:integration host factor subunit beta
MIKSTLITAISVEQPNIPEKDITTSVNLLLELMSEVLGKGGRIEIRGFGSFCLHYRPPRNAHNPKTGARVLTHSKYSPHFKPGKELRDRIIRSAQAGTSIKIETAVDPDDS